MIRCVIRLSAACFIALMMTSAESQFQLNYPTGFTGDDCTGCGYFWPWTPACRWSAPFEVRTGWSRIAIGDKGSAKCRGFEEPSPTEDIYLDIGTQAKYDLKLGEWKDFGLALSISETTITNDRIKQTNTCEIGKSCLIPLKAFRRSSYTQKVSLRQIATQYYYIPGEPQSFTYMAWSGCKDCNDQTRRFSVLCSDPGPEMLPASQVAEMPMPYYPPLLTLKDYCGIIGP